MLPVRTLPQEAPGLSQAHHTPALTVTILGSLISTSVAVPALCLFLPAAISSTLQPGCQQSDADRCSAHMQAGDQRLTDTRQDEQDRCITIKSTGISLYYQMTDQMLKDLPGTVERDGNDFLVSTPQKGIGSGA